MIKSNIMQQGISSVKRKKVCFIITKGVWGGAQKYLFSIATSLSQKKYEVMVIVGEGKILKKKLEDKGVRVYEIWSMKRDFSLMSEIINFIKIFRILKIEYPDVIHLNSPKASGLGALAGRILLTPNIIQTVHGWSFNENRNILSKTVIFIFSWITAILCHKTIVISEKDRRQTKMMPLVSQKIHLVRNGVGDITFIEKNIVRNAVLDRIKYEGQLSESAIWIGTVSELHKNKGLDLIINALSKIKYPFIFLIIGEGEERKNLEKLIEEVGLKKQVFLLGFIDIANLYLKAFDIFTLTSLKEGLPYCILEAGLAKLPVIASNVGGIPDIIKDGESGLLFKRGNVIELEKKIKYLISNKVKQIELGEKLNTKIKKSFSFNQMIKKTIGLYES